MDFKAARSNESYRQILKSMTILGGASFINILLRIVRTKFLAIFLGPSGIGLMAMYNSIAETAGAVAGMGIDTSGVKQVAEAGGAPREIARTVHAIRIAMWCLGGLGMVLVIILSPLIGQFTFENTEHSFDLILLSVVVLFGTLTIGEMALIQGLRRIGDLAKLTILSALFGTLLSVPIVYLWGQKGIIPFLIAVSAMSLLSAWWYARKIGVSRVQMGWAELLREVKPLLNLGVAMMFSVLMIKCTAYLVNVFVSRQLGLEAVGLYQAATVLSSIYVGFIIGSISKDYLPRLTAIAKDNIACNKLVNEQLEVAILLSVPGIVATISFAPIILEIFYSSAFVASFEVLRWQILGVLLNVASWPVFCILLAKGHGKLFVLTVALPCVLHIGLALAGISYVGLTGAGMAFFGMWAFYAIITFSIAKHLTGFTCSDANIQIALVTLPAVGAVFISGLLINSFWSMILGGIITMITAAYSVKSLMGALGPVRFGPFLRTRKDSV